MPSIEYRGFAVAPITLRAPARRVVITSGINGRAMRAPYRARRCNQRLQMRLTVAMMQPSVANTSHSGNSPQRCRGAHCAPADILPTPDSLPPRPPSSREGDRRSGGRSSRIEHPPTFCFLLKPLIQLRVQGRNPARFNGGYGVPRGFKGGSKPSAPCGRLSEAEHPKRKGATLLRPMSAVNRNRPGNSHSRASAPCDFRFPPCFFPRCGRMASIPLIP